MDKAGKEYWNHTWADGVLPRPVDPSLMGLDNLMRRRYHQYFVDLFGKYDTKFMRILEVGCAKSSWLPYFSKQFEFEIVGLDYSPIGCEMAEKVLIKSGVKGCVVCADFFEPPLGMLGTFDFVVSFGVVEHFEDTTACVTAVSAFLKPGGIIITIIPNMAGCIGMVQKMVNRPVYDIHQIIDSKMLRKGHEHAGLEVLKCHYFMSTHFGVCNLNGVSKNNIGWFLKKTLLGVLTRLSKMVWLLEEKIGMFHSGKMASPYVVCVSRK